MSGHLVLYKDASDAAKRIRTAPDITFDNWGENSAHAGRGATTQNRTFVYDPVTLRLTSKTTLETGTAAAGSNPAANGITSYTYNTDGTAASVTDPKGQLTTYTYHTYQRVVKATYGSPATQTYLFSYDADPFGGYSTYAAGRLAAVQWGGMCGPVGGQVPYNVEEYAYTVAGQVSGKQLTVRRLLGGNCYAQVFSAALTYDNEGKVLTTTYPTAANAVRAFVYTNTYDSMSRLTGVSGWNRGRTG